VLPGPRCWPAAAAAAGCSPAAAASAGGRPRAPLCPQPHSCGAAAPALLPRCCCCCRWALLQELQGACSGAGGGLGWWVPPAAAAAAPAACAARRRGPEAGRKSVAAGSQRELELLLLLLLLLQQLHLARCSPRQRCDTTVDAGAAAHGVAPRRAVAAAAAAQGPCTGKCSSCALRSGMARCFTLLCKGRVQCGAGNTAKQRHVAPSAARQPAACSCFEADHGWRRMGNRAQMPWHL
jgi:hypothetical protein